MDYLKKFTKLKERRISQLEKEQKIDNLISKSYQYCPTISLKFLLELKRKNREISKEIYNSNFSNYIDNINNGLNIFDDFYEKYYTESPEIFCFNAKNIFEKL